MLADLEDQPEIKSVMGLANIEAMDGYKLTDSLSPREFSEMVGLDYEVVQMLYSLYAVEHNQLGVLISGLDEFKIPMFDLFMYLKDQMQQYLRQISQKMDDVGRYCERVMRWMDEYNEI